MTPRRKLLPCGRGSQVRRQLGLLRWLAEQDGWVSVAEIEELYPRGARRTMFRDLNQLRALGVPLERDYYHDLGWRLRRSALRRWMGL